MAEGFSHVPLAAELAEGPQPQGLIRPAQVSRFVHIATESEDLRVNHVVVKASFDFKLRHYLASTKKPAYLG